MTPREAVIAGREIVQRMRAERERQGLTRVDVAALGGPTFECLKAVERGRNTPNLITLILYAAVLKWRVELVSREDD